MEFLNAMIPMASFLAVGYIFKKIGAAGEGAKNFLSKYLFYFAMPCLAFRSIAAFDFNESFVPNMVLHNLTTMTLAFLISIAFMYLIKDKNKRGSAHMAVYRGNQGYIGMYAAKSMYGSLALSKSAVINGFENPLVNILAVTGMEIFRTEKSNSTFIKTIGRVLLKVVKNPFVVAVVLGMLESIVRTNILSVAAIDRSLEMAGSTALPLALVLIGASLTFSYIKKNFSLVALLSLIKIALLPLVAWVLGKFVFMLVSIDLAVGVMLLGTPVAVSSYVFAREMGADETLMASCIGLSTILSIFTLPLLKYLLRL